MKNILSYILGAFIVLLVGFSLNRVEAQIISNGGGGGGSGGTVSSITFSSPLTGGTITTTGTVGLTLPLTGNAVTLGGDVTGASNANTAVGSSNLQQPVMFIGSSAIKNIAATTTTGTINTPTGTVNGDLELVFITLNNATSSAFTPPAGWSAVASCNAAGNTTTIQIFSHTAASEGGTIAAFTWTTNGTGNAWASAFRNASVDVCAATNAATATTFSVGGITAAATNDRIVSVGAQPSNSGARAKSTSPATGSIVDDFIGSTQGTVSEVSYPITGTTVASYGFTSTATGVWTGAMIGLSFATSTTAGPPGAVTYGQFGSAYLSSLILGGGLSVAGTAYGLVLPNGVTTGGIGSLDGDGVLKSVLTGYSSATINIGDTTALNGGGAVIQFDSKTQYANDTNAVSAGPRAFATFPIAAVAATTTTQWGEKKIAKAITIENVVFSVGAFTCSGNPALSLFDCSSTAGTCTPVSTLATSGTLTAIGVTNAASTPTTTVAAGEYMAVEFTAGTCTVFNGSVDAEYRLQ